MNAATSEKLILLGSPDESSRILGRAVRVSFGTRVIPHTWCTAAQVRTRAGRHSGSASRRARSALYRRVGRSRISRCAGRVDDGGWADPSHRRAGWNIRWNHARLGCRAYTGYRWTLNGTHACVSCSSIYLASGLCDLDSEATLDQGLGRISQKGKCFRDSRVCLVYHSRSPLFFSARESRRFPATEFMGFQSFSALCCGISWNLFTCSAFLCHVEKIYQGNKWYLFVEHWTQFAQMATSGKIHSFSRRHARLLHGSQPLITFSWVAHNARAKLLPNIWKICLVSSIFLAGPKPFRSRMWFGV